MKVILLLQRLSGPNGAVNTRSDMDASLPSSGANVSGNGEQDKREKDGLFNDVDICFDFPR